MSRRRPRVIRSLGLLLTALLALPLLAVWALPAAAGSPTATITILHGLPNFTADVYVNDTLTLDGFTPESATDALSLPAGDYDIAIRGVGSDPTSDPALQGTITLKAGKNYSAIAHLSATGEPALDLFENDMARIPVGKSQLIVRNVAQTSPIDLRLNGSAAVKGLASGEAAAKKRAPGSFTASAVDAADGTELIAGTPIRLTEGTQTIVYVVGSADDATLDFMVQSISDLASDPGSVFSGNGGLASPEGFPTWAAGLMALCLAIAVGSVVVLRRGR
jgi:hypothetical protein